MTDPFADATVTATEQNMTTTPEVPTVNADSDQNYVTVILKGGKGYDAPSISIRGGSVPDALEQMQTHQNELKELVDTTAKVAGYFNKLIDGEKQQIQPQQSAPQKQGPSAPSDDTCTHGREYKEGMSKAGKAYKAHFCSAKQCDPYWVK